MLDKKGEDFQKLLEKYDKKQQKALKIPYKKLKPKFEIFKRDVNGTVCYVVRQRGSKPQKAILYLFGGGYILPPDTGDIVLCSEIAAESIAFLRFLCYNILNKPTIYIRYSTQRTSA